MQGIRRIKRNGENRVVRDGTTVYEGRRKGGRREGKPEREIPHFCYHERRGVAGNCRMCRVEREGGIKPVAGCTRPMTNGRKLGTETPRVKKAREGVMERRLRNHPRDCPICDQGGECDLQDQAMEYGTDRSRRTERKRGVEDKERGPVVKTVMTRCIHCTRCVRYVGEVGGKGELGILGRGKEAEIGRYVEGQVVAEGRGGNRVDRCPVGALTSKEYEFKGRPWERKGRETVDRRDGMGSGRKRERRGGERKRVRPKREKDRNGEWLSDKSRLGYDGRKYNRRLERYSLAESGFEGKTTRKGKERKKRLDGVLGKKERKRRVGTGVDRERRSKRKEEERKGKRKVETRGRGERGKRRRQGKERGRKKGRKRRKEKGRSLRRVGRNREKERPRRGTRRREGQIEEEGQRKKRGNTSGSDRGKKGSSQTREGRTRSERRKRKEGEKEGGKGVRLGRTRRSRNDGKEWLKRRRRREGKGRLPKGVNLIHHRGNTMGRRRRNLGGKQKRERKDSLDGRIGVDEGERKENGRSLDTRKGRERRRSSHGRNGRKEDGRAKKARRRPRRTGREGNRSRANTEGKIQTTYGYLKGDSEKRRNEEERSIEDGQDRIVDECMTKSEKGYGRGWNTRRNENRYDYYREGHRINRSSKVMAKRSRESNKENR